MRKAFVALVFFTFSVQWSFAQLEPIPEERGATGLVLKLRELSTGASFLQATAHPDDEDNGLLVLLSRGRGIRTALLTATRGDGGQNEIGPELFEAIGIVRTEELMAMHRQDGVQQYFTAAYEFGYSFSVEETLEKWGKEQTLGDIVRVIRTTRPDVVTTLRPSGRGGGQHHQTSAILTREAFRAAADPNRFPEQIEEGLRPWQALKLYSRSGIGAGRGRARRSRDEEAHLVTMDIGAYDPILGRSYFQMGLEGRSSHRCQGMAQLRALPGSRQSVYKLEDAVLDVASEEMDLFDGVEMSLSRWKDFVEDEGDAAQFVRDGIDALQDEVAAAEKAFDGSAPWKTLPPLRRGLEFVRKLRHDVASSSLSPLARYELEHRLAPKTTEFEEAIVLAHGMGFDPIASRGEVTRGGRFEIHARVVNPSPEPIVLQSIEALTPEGWGVVDESAPRGATLANNLGLESCFRVTVSTDAVYDRPFWERNHAVDRFDIADHTYFGQPWRSPAVHAQVTFRSGDTEVSLSEPVQYRYEGPWVGTEKQKIVSVLPLVSVTLAPKVVVFPTAADDKTRLVSVEAVYKGTEPAEGVLVLEAPAGWSVEPTRAELRFQRENEAITVRFQVTPPEAVESGGYDIKAAATLNGETFREGFQTIAYHHIQTRYLFHPAQATVQALDVQVAPVKVGYVMGVGDEIPTAIRQLGAELVMLEEQDLAEGDLSHYDVIITGVRAYLNREDLRAYNHRLLDYVKDGGTMLVMYNKFEFNSAQWGPYPKKVSRNRVTVEEAPIQILEPEHPVFQRPNRITENDWYGWVQERGLYFLEEEGDPRYRELLAAEDPWDYNAGTKKGMLVEAEYGKGRWMYIGLGFFRQLPAGVPDAYKVFANLLSLPKAAAEASEQY